MKFFIGLSLSLFSLLLLNPVNADSSVNIPISGYDGRNEVFSVNTSTGALLNLTPYSCDGISSIEVKLEKGVTNGTITVLSPQQITETGNISNVYDPCALNYKNIDSEMIDYIRFNFKVRQSWLDNNRVGVDDLALYSYLPEQWQSDDIEVVSYEDAFVVYQSKEVQKADIYTLASAQSGGFNFSNLLNPSPLIIIICFACVFILFLIFIVFSFFRAREIRRGGYQSL